MIDFQLQEDLYCSHDLRDIAKQDLLLRSAAVRTVKISIKMLYSCTLMAFILTLNIFLITWLQYSIQCNVMVEEQLNLYYLLVVL